VFTGTLIHNARTVRMSLTGIEWPCQGGGCDECVRVHLYPMSEQSLYEQTMLLPTTVDLGSESMSECLEYPKSQIFRRGAGLPSIRVWQIVIAMSSNAL